MPITYTPIASTTLTSDSTSVTFTSIPATFTDLVIVMSVGKGISYTTGLQFNGVTTLTYSRTRLSGDGTTASSARNTTAQAFQYIPLGSENIVAHLLNYSNTTTFKTTLSRSNAASSGLDASVGLWQSTAAINLIRIAPDVDTPARTSFLTGSTFTIYGIKAA
jgi:hypothetical protein